jgi:hypothetical protein
MGVLYFVQIEQDGPIKIGFTSYADPSRRVHQLQSGCPWRLRLIGHRPGTKVHEKALHELLAPYRMQREWFREAPVVVKTVREVLEPGFEWPLVTLLDRAISQAGSQTALANAIGCGQSALSLARKNGVSPALARRVNSYLEGAA